MSDWVILAWKEQRQGYYSNVLMDSCVMQSAYNLCGILYKKWESRGPPSLSALQKHILKVPEKKMLNACRGVMPYHLRHLAAGFSQRRPSFATRVAHLGFVVDKVALGQVFLRVLRFSPVSIIPPLLHIHTCMIWGLDNGPASGRSYPEYEYEYKNVPLLCTSYHYRIPLLLKWVPRMIYIV
jgi:hypothetical protein